MLLAAFALSGMLYPDDLSFEEPVSEVVQEEVIEVPSQSIVPEVIQIHIEPEIDKRKPVDNFNSIVTPEVYEEQMAVLPPLYVPPPPPPRLGEVFMYEVLHRPHIRRMRYDEFQAASLYAGNIVAYLWISNVAIEQVIQYAAIATDYGNVYITCELNQDGEIVDPDAPLKVYYDNLALEQMVAVAAEEVPHRFPTFGRFNTKTIRCMDDLNFLFGNPQVAGESYNISFLL
jgi:hypothetical protein